MPLPPPTAASPLDVMPPAPPMGAATPPGLDAMNAGAPAMQIGSAQLPPEVLTGIMQAGQTMAQTIEGFAQVTPDLGPDWLAVKQLLMQVLAKLATSGAGPASATSPGIAFPAGGAERGGRPY